MRRFFPLAAVAGLALVVAACGPDLDAEEPVQTNAVEVSDNSFGPLVAEVPAGTAVTWTWVGDRPHNVSGQTFKSDTQEEGTFTYTFETAGTYDYDCELHGGMEGRVVVTES